jgi:AcrR family transcriptional regulator
VQKTRKRPYKSSLRQRQAGDTRRRIVEAAQQLLKSEGYGGMTIEGIALRADVSAQTIYAIFKSKTGILVALLDQSMFGPDYDEVVRRTLSTSDPETRLRSAASRCGCSSAGAQSAAFELMRVQAWWRPNWQNWNSSASVLRRGKGRDHLSPRLRKAPTELTEKTARDIFWMLTGGCVPDAGASVDGLPQIPRVASGHSGALLLSAARSRQV